MSESSADTRWLGDDQIRFNHGDTGFLIEMRNADRGWTRYELRDHPAQMAGTLEPRLYGSVGGGRTAVTALGVWRVEEARPNGRGRARRLSGAELAEALDTLGYPELAGQDA